MADLCSSPLDGEGPGGIAPVLTFPGPAPAEAPLPQAASEPVAEPPIEAPASLGAVLFDDLETDLAAPPEPVVLAPAPEPVHFDDLRESEVEDLLPRSGRGRGRWLLAAGTSLAVGGLLFGLLPGEPAVPSYPEPVRAPTALPAAPIAQTPIETAERAPLAAPTPVTADPAPAATRKVRRRGRRSSLRVLPRAGPRPRSAKLANLLEKGRRTYLRESYAAAYKTYRKAVQTDPGNTEARFGLALTAFQVGRNFQSRRQVEATLRLQPDHPDGLILLGFLDQIDSRLSVAAEHYERYLVLYPDGEWADEIRSVLATLNDA